MNTISTSVGPRMAFEPRAWALLLEPVAAMAFAMALDRRADFLHAEGQWLQADRVAHAAFEVRARACGGRA